MEFQPIEMLWSSFNTSSKADTSENQQSSMFADIFDSVVQNVRETDAAKNEKAYELATGQLDNPAEYTFAATQAELSVSMMVELRNRALDAYNEVIRMSL